MINETREQRIARREKIYQKKKAEEYESRKLALLHGDDSIISDIPLVCLRELRGNLENELSENMINYIDNYIRREENLIKDKRMASKSGRNEDRYPLRDAYAKFGAQGAFALMGLR